MNAVSQLAETVEDISTEKVRLSGLQKIQTGATRIRSEDEIKRLQSSNDLILLNENAKHLSSIISNSIKENEKIIKIIKINQN